MLQRTHSSVHLAASISTEFLNNAMHLMCMLVEVVAKHLLTLCTCLPAGGIYEYRVEDASAKAEPSLAKRTAKLAKQVRATLLLHLSPELSTRRAGQAGESNLLTSIL
jgi:hypothetical protein